MKIFRYCLVIFSMVLPLTGRSIPTRDKLHDDSPVEVLFNPYQDELAMCGENAPLVYSPNALRMCGTLSSRQEEQAEGEFLNRPVEYNWQQLPPQS